MEQKYCIERHGNVYFMTAQQLCNRILEDKKSDYNWIASATELVRICRQPDFPDYCAREIKIAILNCFANLELKNAYINSTDEEAVYYCYNSLSVTFAFNTKAKFISSIIQAVIEYDDSGYPRVPAHLGTAYEQICKRWKMEKKKERNLNEIRDFKQWKKYLRLDFKKTIEKAEDEGVFKEDDDKMAKTPVSSYNVTMFQ